MLLYTLWWEEWGMDWSLPHVNKSFSKKQWFTLSAVPLASIHRIYWPAAVQPERWPWTELCIVQLLTRSFISLQSHLHWAATVIFSLVCLKQIQTTKVFLLSCKSKSASGGYQQRVSVSTQLQHCYRDVLLIWVLNETRPSQSILQLISAAAASTGQRQSASCLICWFCVASAVWIFSVSLILKIRPAEIISIVSSRQAAKWIKPKRNRRNSSLLTLQWNPRDQASNIWVRRL